MTLPSPPNFDLDPYAIGVRKSKRARIEKKVRSPNATPQPLPSADSAAGVAASSAACPAAVSAACPAAWPAAGSTAEATNYQIDIINQWYEKIWDATVTPEPSGSGVVSNLQCISSPLPVDEGIDIAFLHDWTVSPIAARQNMVPTSSLPSTFHPAPNSYLSHGEFSVTDDPSTYNPAPNSYVSNGERPSIADELVEPTLIRSVYIPASITKYVILLGMSRKGGDIVTDSVGHRFSKQKESSKTVFWKCCSRAGANYPSCTAALRKKKNHFELFR